MSIVFQLLKTVACRLISFTTLNHVESCLFLLILGPAGALPQNKFRGLYSHAEVEVDR
jgi:hypothetical protein